MHLWSREFGLRVLSGAQACLASRRSLRGLGDGTLGLPEGLVCAGVFQALSHWQLCHIPGQSALSLFNV